ncbi:hypothetical protein [Treponema phagedenis]|uniref:hypothetical protein n=1 Tax=Treponema phagedenis TaxID=162 RepID=UPI0004BBE15E|nr:hypothetical protein [Treponema phagedenis]NVP23504.1 hypothetical protein [Treponema phagedenis]QKS93011.1 hypothetical protein HPJ96_10975 [Treponema phagedenis]QLC58345.1 hypothetical protein HW453_05595 [Treponema phagedenis]
MSKEVSEKQIGITTFFQNRKGEYDDEVIFVLQKMYADVAFTEAQWVLKVNEFLEQKIV